MKLSMSQILVSPLIAQEKQAFGNSSYCMLQYKTITNDHS